MHLEVIEKKIAWNEMSPAQVFTQMKQHIISRNDVLDEAIEKINGCELVEPPSPGVMRIRLYEALGSIISLKDKSLKCRIKEN